MGILGPIREGVNPGNWTMPGGSIFGGPRLGPVIGGKKKPEKDPFAAGWRNPNPDVKVIPGTTIPKKGKK